MILMTSLLFPLLVCLRASAYEADASIKSVCDRLDDLMERFQDIVIDRQQEEENDHLMIFDGLLINDA